MIYFEINGVASSYCHTSISGLNLLISAEIHIEKLKASLKLNTFLSLSSGVSILFANYKITKAALCSLCFSQ